MHSRCKFSNPTDWEADRLEAAVEACDFAAIPALAAGYRRVLVLALAHTADKAERRRLLEHGRETLNRALHLTRARRAHLAGRLAASAAHSAAFDPPQCALHTWHLEG